jgi:hypothetical protein
LAGWSATFVLWFCYLWTVKFSSLS